MDYKFTAKYTGVGEQPSNFTPGDIYEIDIIADKDFVSMTAKASRDGSTRYAEYRDWSWKEIMVNWQFQFKSLLEEVLLERVRQDHKFGKRTQHSMIWHTILSEEVGEVAREICDSRFAWKPESNYRKELIEAAAVALAAVQDYDLSGEYGQESKQ